MPCRRSSSATATSSRPGRWAGCTTFVEQLPAWAAEQGVRAAHPGARRLPPRQPAVRGGWRASRSSTGRRRCGGRAPMDLASFLATSLTVEDRRRHEGGLLDHYTATLGGRATRRRGRDPLPLVPAVVDGDLRQQPVPHRPRRRAGPGAVRAHDRPHVPGRRRLGRRSSCCPPERAPLSGTTVRSMSAEARLTELGIDLPRAPRPMASYVTACRSGNLVFTAGPRPGPPRRHGGDRQGRRRPRRGRRARRRPAHRARACWPRCGPSSAASTGSPASSRCWAWSTARRTSGTTPR